MVLRSNRRDFDERVDESESEMSRCRGVRDRSVCSRLWSRRWGVELLRLVNFPTLAPICCRSGEDLRRGSVCRRSGEDLRQGSVRRRSGDDFRLGCVVRRSVVSLKRSSEEVLRRRSGDHLAILDPTGYLDILADLDGVTQGDAAIFDSGISLTTLGLVSPTGPGCLVGFILGRHTTLGSFLHTYIVLGSGGGIVGVADSSLRSSVMYAMRWSSHCSMSAVSKWPKATAASFAVFDFGNAFKNSVSTPAGRGLGTVSTPACRGLGQELLT